MCSFPAMLALIASVSLPIFIFAEKVMMRVPYEADDVACNGFIAYDDQKCTDVSKCPGVVIVQDWNGMNEYEMARACMIADMGYVAFAADIYGVDTPVDNMQDWMSASRSHSSNATKYMRKINGAFSKLLEYGFVHGDKLAAMGYCFGGTGLVNVAMAGHSGVEGVVFPPGLSGVISFHGGLTSGWMQPKQGTRPKLLLHSGGKDDANDAIANLTNDLESVGAVYEIARYGSMVVHTFTEWDAKVPGRSMYDALTDARSWSASLHFLKELFTTGVAAIGKPDMGSIPVDFKEENVSYLADGTDSMGYMIYNQSKCTVGSPCPGVIIVQDWNGMNEYEKERAYMIADLGYVAFAADIYGVDTPAETMSDWMAASTKHNSNATMYMGKIRDSFSKLLDYGFVHSDKLAAIGYCFGGTGLVNVAMAGHSGLPGVIFPSGLLGVVSFHGGLSRGWTSPANGTRPKLLLHSGGEDDTNTDISKLTDDLESISATYELTRYGPNVVHSFTEWDSNMPGRAMYDARADFRSWADTIDFLQEIFSGQTGGTQKPSSEQCKASNNPQPTTNNPQPTTNKLQPTTNNQQPTTSNQQATTNGTTAIPSTSFSWSLPSPAVAFFATTFCVSYA
eukprot:TRINITY_DN6962_c0_g1_i7.p1 TRINITY_DN6962_c0_g1~~TRINITY_DN6962_c0_g1_i7.p1  ORF type:complete len:621 (-),score=69.08 TRINITY_DN6962_c0_g1_i7:253-2115(-)